MFVLILRAPCLVSGITNTEKTAQLPLNFQRPSTSLLIFYDCFLATVGYGTAHLTALRSPESSTAEPASDCGGCESFHGPRLVDVSRFAVASKRRVIVDCSRTNLSP